MTHHSLLLLCIHIILDLDIDIYNYISYKLFSFIHFKIPLTIAISMRQLELLILQLCLHMVHHKCQATEVKLRLIVSSII